MEDIRKCFEKFCNLWDKPETDLFATRLNSKLTKYKSWKTDARSASIDVFSISWNYCHSYCFPPLSLIWKVINKIRRKCQLTLLITILWPIQSWFPAILRQAITTPPAFSRRQLQLPGPTKTHPLASKLQLFCYRTIHTKKRTTTYSSPPGAIQQNIHILQWDKFCIARNQLQKIQQFSLQIYMNLNSVTP